MGEASRRAFVVAAASLTAGCSERLLSNVGSDGRTLASMHELRFRVENLPSESDVATLTAERTAEMTADHPARVRVRFTNTGEREREFDFGDPPPFAAYFARQQGGEARLYLLPPDGRGFNPEFPDERYVLPERPTEGCWRALDEPSFNAMAVPRTLAPGESIVREYLLLSDPAQEGCFPPGAYRFVGWGGQAFAIVVE
jgi:hypothetical protein